MIISTLSSGMNPKTRFMVFSSVTTSLIANALTWTRTRGYLHTGIDSDESKPTANRTPILVADGAFPAEQVRREFIVRGNLLPAEIRELVLERIKDYESHQSS